MTNVRFYTLNALPTWVDSTCQGAFINLTATDGSNTPGLYFGANDGWTRLSNVAQDTTSEIHSASINTETGVVSFFNSEEPGGDALFTLGLADYISAERAKLATENDVVIATNTDGVVTIKAGVKEEKGVIAQGTGSDITLAKVATTGKAADIKFDAINLEGASENPIVKADATLPEVISGIEKQIIDLDASSTLTLKNVDGTTATEVTADGSTYKLYQGTKEVCAFNIEKDSFVREGSVVYGSMTEGVFTENNTTGEAFIKLIIRESDEAGTTDEKVIYIPAASLVDQIKVTANDGVADATDGTQNASTAYLTYNSDTNSLVITDKVKQAIALAETSIQSVNGKKAENGAVTIKANDIETKFAKTGTDVAEGTKLTIDEKFDELDKDSVNAAEVTEGETDDADQLKFIKAQVAPNNTEDATAGKKVTIDVTYGKFAQDENGNLPMGEETAVVAGVDGIATIAEVSRVITANEEVAAAALTDLDNRVKVLEQIDPVVTTVVENNTDESSVNVTITDTPDSGTNDHKYVVKADLVWLTNFPTTNA